MGSDARNSAFALLFGSNGKPLKLRDLPPSEAAHWTPRLKAEVVHAVRTGLLSFDEAGVRYALSREEFSSWEHKFYNSQQLGPTRAEEVKSGMRLKAAPYH